jgi:hypothetical protein
MPWPKGVPRVGYVRKDGQPHNKKGEGRAQGPRITVVQKPDPTIKTTVRRDVDPDRIEKAKPAIHGGTSRPIIEVCPNCSYAYADGGYCPECGWTTWQGARRK